MIKAGLNEFEVNDRLDRDASFIFRLINEKPDTIPLMKTAIFSVFNFSNADLDNWFKLSFLYKFYNRQIKYQTIELFKTNLLGWMHINKKYLEVVWDNYDDIILGNSRTENESKVVDQKNGTRTNLNKNKSQDRSATSDLPQNKINLDVTDNILPYASNNRVAFLSSEQSGSATDTNNGLTQNTGNTKSYSFDAEKVLFAQSIFQSQFKQLDKALFLGVL